MTAQHTTSRPALRTLTIATLLLGATAACSGGQTEKKPLAEKSEEIEAVEKKTVSSMTFEVASEGSKVTFGMQAPFEKQDGAVPQSATSGELNVDLDDLSKSTGLINVDISALEIYQQAAEEEGAYGERTKSDLQNEHMRDWLEIGEDAPEAEREKNKVIQFELSDIEAPSATDINGLEGEQRKVTFTGVGKFRLHQRSAEKKVKMEAIFTYAGDKPTQVQVRTVEPFIVDLDEHDVRPRTGFGQLAEKTLSAMSPKVGKEAEVSVAFTAKAAS